MDTVSHLQLQPPCISASLPPLHSGSPLVPAGTPPPVTTTIKRGRMDQLGHVVSATAPSQVSPSVRDTDQSLVLGRPLAADIGIGQLVQFIP